MRLAVFSLDLVFAEALGSLLRHAGGFDVAACQTHLGAARQITKEGDCVFVITEDFIDDAGLFLLSKIRETSGAKIVLLSRGEQQIAPDRLPVDAIVSSRMGVSALLHAIRATSDAPGLEQAERVASAAAQGGGMKDRWKDSEVSFSPRERETADLIVQGFSNREIAKLMGVSEQSAKNYVRSLMKKLGCSSRLQLGLALSRSKEASYGTERRASTETE